MLLHQTHSMILTNLSIATLPSLGQPSEWSTLPRNELNPSARTQVPCAQILTYFVPSSWRLLSFWRSCYMILKKTNLIFDNPVLHLSQPLLFLRIAKCDHSSHQVFKIFHMLQSGPSGFMLLQWDILNYDLTSKSLKVMPLTWGLLGFGGGRGSPSPCNSWNYQKALGIKDHAFLRIFSIIQGISEYFCQKFAVLLGNQGP